ncbi:hypothetical protein H5410_033137, partial [Solanum commersonii]
MEGIYRRTIFQSLGVDEQKVYTKVVSGVNSVDQPQMNQKFKAITGFIISFVTEALDNVPLKDILDAIRESKSILLLDQQSWPRIYKICCSKEL